MRWIDLSAHDLRLYVIVLPNARALVIDGKTDPHGQSLAELGFRQRKSGIWVKSDLEVNPRQYLRLFPNAKVREMEQDEYVVKLGQDMPASSGAASTDAPKPVQDDLPISKIIGYNRLGQQVIEEEGRRLIVDVKGRRISEDQIATPMPGMFLHAVDDGSLAMCAEGYLRTILEDAAQSHARLKVFSTAIGKKDGGKALRSAVEAAMPRFILKQAGASLHEKFSSACKLRDGMAKDAVAIGDAAAKAIIARRLIGQDREMLGRTIYAPAEVASLLQGIVPRSVFLGSNLGGADYAVIAAEDVAEAADALAGAKDGALVAISTNVPENTSPEEVVQSLSGLGYVEAAAYLEASRDLYVTIKAHAEPRAEPLEVTPVADDGELWSWSTRVTADRSAAIEAIKSGIATSVELTAADASVVDNSHQVPYASASKIGKPQTMVPKELQEATTQALTRVSTIMGDVDDRVAKECGFPREKLEEYLAPEQIDAVALAIHAEERDRGFLIADGTGVGKGRALMTLVKRALLQGRKVFLQACNDNNLTDLMREAKRLDALDIIKPAILNRGLKLIDDQTGEPFETVDDQILAQAVEDEVWPEGVNLIFSTYSQFNRMPDDSPRARWIRNAIDSDVVYIGDEIHLAASGVSNTSQNVAVAIEKAGSIVLSSATYAVDARMVGFYERIFPHGISADEIVAMMRRGGDQFHEVVAGMLVADGVMVRRERDLSQLQFSYQVDTERYERNKILADKRAAILAEMKLLSGELDRAANEHNRNRGNILKGLQMKRLDAGAPLQHVQGLFDAALLADFAAEKAIEILRNGGKPELRLVNTAEEFLRNPPVPGRAPDFKDVLHRLLDQLTKATVTDADGDAQQVDMVEGNRAALEAVSNLRGMIDEFPDLPVSLFDVVRDRIEEAGYTCGEISGRSLEFRDGKIVPRRIRDRVAITNAYNNGRYDALLTSLAGSTSANRQASETVDDQRPRFLIDLQPPMSVVGLIQGYGRVSRNGEVAPATIVSLSTGLPHQIHRAAMMNQKLRRYSANVTSNRDNPFLKHDIPDIINPVGDMVVARYAETRPDLMRRLYLDGHAEDHDGNGVVDLEKSEGQIDTDRLANRFLANLGLLKVEDQNKVFRDLLPEYRLQVAELEAKGENPLRPKELEGIVHIRSKKLFEGSDDVIADTAFDGPMHVLDVAIERVTDPIRSETVMAAIDDGAEASARVQQALQNIRSSRDLYLEPFIKGSARNVGEAIAQGQHKVMKMSAALDDLGVALEVLSPGREVAFDLGDGEVQSAIITRITAPVEGFEHLPHLYRVHLARPGATSIHMFSLDTLLKMPGVSSRDESGRLQVNVSEGLEGSDYDRVLDKFEAAVGRKMTPRRILTSNLFRAVRLATQYKLGSYVSFVDADGKRHRGVLVNKQFERKLEALSVRIDGKAAAMDALTRVRAEVTSSPTGSKTGLKITPVAETTWKIRFPLPPKRNGATQWPSEAYREIFEKGEIEANGRFSGFACTNVETLSEILDVFTDTGCTTFYIPSKYRERMMSGEVDMARIAGARP